MLTLHLLSRWPRRPRVRRDDRISRAGSLTSDAAGENPSCGPMGCSDQCDMADSPGPPVEAHAAATEVELVATGGARKRGFHAQRGRGAPAGSSHAYGSPSGCTVSNRPSIRRIPGTATASANALAALPQSASDHFDTDLGEPIFANPVLCSFQVRYNLLALTLQHDRRWRHTTGSHAGLCRTPGRRAGCNA